MAANTGLLSVGKDQVQMAKVQILSRVLGTAVKFDLKMTEP